MTGDNVIIATVYMTEVDFVFAMDKLGLSSDHAYITGRSDIDGTLTLKVADIFFLQMLISVSQL